MSEKEDTSDGRSDSEFMDTTQDATLENLPINEKDKKQKKKDKGKKQVKKTKRIKPKYAIWNQRVDKKNEIQSYLEIVDSLEHEHRSDLSLHLYSIFLLKKLIRKANEKKFPLETEIFIKEKLSDDMIKWPNRYSVVDPQVDKIYEDNPPKFLENDILNEAAVRERLIHNSLELNKSDVRNNLPIDVPVAEDLIPGEVSERAMRHAANMMNIELNAMWGRKLNVSAKRAGINLDVDRTTIPREIGSDILGKLDRVMNGLHLKMAEKNQIDIEKVSSEEEDDVEDDNSETSTDGNEPHGSDEDNAEEESVKNVNPTNNSVVTGDQILTPHMIKRKAINRQRDLRRRAQQEKGKERVTYLHHFDEINENENVKYKYHEILDRCFEMDQDMKDIYMKSLKLFNDIPNGYRKKDYKIKKDILKKYRVKINKDDLPLDSTQIRQFYKVNSLYDNKDVPSIRKTFIDLLTRKDTEQATEWKTFVQVQENQRKLYGEDRITYQTNSLSEVQQHATPKLNSNLMNSTMEPYIEKWNEIDSDEYNIADCLLPVPVGEHKKHRVYDHTSNEFD